MEIDLGQARRRARSCCGLRAPELPTRSCGCARTARRGWRMRLTATRRSWAATSQALGASRSRARVTRCSCARPCGRRACGGWSRFCWSRATCARQIPNCGTRSSRFSWRPTQVKSVLSAPDSDARNQLIVAHLDRLERELAQTSTAVGELRDLLERPPAGRPVEHRTVPPTSAIAIRQTIDRKDILAWWQGALGDEARDQRRRPTAGVLPGRPSRDGEHRQVGDRDRMAHLPLRSPCLSLA